MGSNINVGHNDNLGHNVHFGTHHHFGTQRRFGIQRCFGTQRHFGMYRHFGTHQLQGGSIVVLYESKCIMIYQKCNYFEEDALIYLNLLKNCLILSIE